LPDPIGKFFAGPGDRVAGEILRGLSPLEPREWSIPPGSNQLLLDFPIPTNVAFPPPINGRTTQLYMHSDAPIYLSEVAVFANGSSPSDFVSPSKEDFQSVLSKNARAGALEAPATPLIEGKEIKKGFRYGRVAGVTRGATWNSNLSSEVAPLAPGETVGFPISAVHLNRLGTQQVQSAPLTSRYPDSAYQGHGNYGVRYEMVLRLENPSPEPRAYALALSHPTQVTSQGAHHVASFRTPPDKAVTFRGLVRVDEWTGTRTLPPRFTHIVLRRGQTLPPFETLAIPAQGRRDLTISLIYPADATPPQLLTIQRI
jgi:hypothetical protein